MILRKSTTCVFGIVSLCFAISCSDKQPSASADKKPAAAYAQQWAVTPGQSVGPVNFQMAKNEVLAAAGQPRAGSGNALDYPELGMSVIFKKDGSIGSINCGSMEGDQRVISNCKVETPEGIKLGSTREEIIKAYGQPTTVSQNPEKLRYDKLSADFMLKDGRLVYAVWRSAR